MRLYPLSLCLLGLPTLVGCQDVVEHGTLTICTTMEDPSPTSNALTTHAGEVIAIDDGTVDCTRSVTIVDELGISQTIGLTVTDSLGQDITPMMDVNPGDAITLDFHLLRVWGWTMGFVLTDADGIVLAADEGTWGGALTDVDLGFRVDYSTEPIATATSECLTSDYFDITFAADTATSVAAGSSDALIIDGTTYMATAINATKFGPGRRCEVSDKSNYLTWIVAR